MIEYKGFVVRIQCMNRPLEIYGRGFHPAVNLNGVVVEEMQMMVTTTMMLMMAQVCAIPPSFAFKEDAV